MKPVTTQDDAVLRALQRRTRSQRMVTELVLSFWTRDVEHNGVLTTCEELGMGFVPFSPLGAGFLTGTIDATTKIESTEGRSRPG